MFSKSSDATPDDLVLEYAASQGRIILTLNETDFRRLHEVDAKHAGIISCPEPSAKQFKKVARQIDRFLKTIDMNSRFERLPHV